MRRHPALPLIAALAWLGAAASAPAADPELRPRPRPAPAAVKPGSKPRPKPRTRPRPKPSPEPEEDTGSDAAPAGTGSPVASPRPVASAAAPSVRPAAPVRAPVAAPPARPRLTGQWRYRTGNSEGSATIVEHTPDGRVRGSFRGDDGVGGSLDGEVVGDRVRITSVVKVLFVKVRTGYDGRLSIVGGRPQIDGTYAGDATSGTFTMSRQD